MRQDPGFNRKEMVISCPPPSAPPMAQFPDSRRGSDPARPLGRGAVRGRRPHRNTRDPDRYQAHPGIRWWRRTLRREGRYWRWKISQILLFLALLALAIAFKELTSQ